MKRKNWIVTTAIFGLITSLAVCLVANTPKASAMVEPIDSSNITEETIATIPDFSQPDRESLDVDAQHPDVDNVELEVSVETTDPNPELEVEPEPETKEPEATEPDREPELDVEKNESVNEEKHDGCNHFWRREYEPETATEEGCIFDSCLYCGKWYIVEIIPPFGN